MKKNTQKKTMRVHVYPDRLAMGSIYAMTSRFYGDIPNDPPKKYGERSQVYAFGHDWNHASIIAAHWTESGPVQIINSQ